MAKETKVVNPYKTHWYHRKLPYWFRKDRDRLEGTRSRPEVVRLDVEPGTKPNGKPPVRIFLGTESSQYRAERLFVWSVKKVRDPARVYEIYLMNNLKGIDRTGWKTGFTNYRYTIPTLAGRKGRAIYNDADQIYLADPGEMFDMDMKGAGVAAITQNENAVTLIDCEKMIQHWTMEDVRAGKKHNHFKAAVTDKSLWVKLPGQWNSRDGEYPLEETKCLHYTTLHTQPWRPFPDQLRYFPTPLSEIWLQLEHEADANGFTLFTKEHPSQRFSELLEQYQITHFNGKAEGADRGEPLENPFDGRRLQKSLKPVAKLVRETGAKTILDYGAGQGRFYQSFPGESVESRFKCHPAWPGVRVICYDPGYEPFSKPYEGEVDGVISTDVLEHISEEDIPWVLDEMFRFANRFVYFVAACFPADKILPNGENAHCTIETPEWWKGQVEMAARRVPGVRWVLACEERKRFGKTRKYFKGGDSLAKSA